jgi:hypothetical protein
MVDSKKHVGKLFDLFWRKRAPRAKEVSSLEVRRLSRPGRRSVGVIDDFALQVASPAAQSCRGAGSAVVIGDAASAAREVFERLQTKIAAPELRADGCSLTRAGMPFVARGLVGRQILAVPGLKTATLHSEALHDS